MKNISFNKVMNLVALICAIITVIALFCDSKNIVVAIAASTLLVCTCFNVLPKNKKEEIKELIMEDEF